MKPSLLLPSCVLALAGCSPMHNYAQQRPVRVNIAPMQVGLTPSALVDFDVVMDGTRAAVRAERWQRGREAASRGLGYWAANNALYRPLYEKALLAALHGKDCHVTQAVPEPEWSVFEFAYECAGRDSL